MSRKRVFSPSEQGMNFSDYNRNKNGCEILKTIKREDNIAVLDRYKSYSNWQTLNTSYYKYIDNEVLTTAYAKSLYNSSENYIFYKKESKNLCQPETYQYEEENTCQPNILYPYGKTIIKKTVNPWFNSKIYLCKWCNGKNVNIYGHLITCEKCDNKSTYDCNCKNKTTKCNLCKNARALFI